MTKHYISEIVKLFDTEFIFQFGDKIEYSKDIDILIVSNEFEGISTLKRRELIKRIDPNLDPICLTNRQFEMLKDSKSSLFNCIQKTQTLLYGNETALF